MWTGGTSVPASRLPCGTRGSCLFSRRLARLRVLWHCPGSYTCSPHQASSSNPASVLHRRSDQVSSMQSNGTSLKLRSRITVCTKSMWFGIIPQHIKSYKNFHSSSSWRSQHGLPLMNSLYWQLFCYFSLPP